MSTDRGTLMPEPCPFPFHQRPPDSWQWEVSPALTCVFEGMACVGWAVREAGEPSLSSCRRGREPSQRNIVLALSQGSPWSPTDSVAQSTLAPGEGGSDDLSADPSPSGTDTGPRSAPDAGSCHLIPPHPTLPCRSSSTAPTPSTFRPLRHVNERLEHVHWPAAKTDLPVPDVRQAGRPSSPLSDTGPGRPVRVDLGEHRGCGIELSCTVNERGPVAGEHSTARTLATLFHVPSCPCRYSQLFRGG